MMRFFKNGVLTTPILAGRLRGMRWAPAAGGKLLRLYLGTYEPAQTSLFCQRVGPGDVVIDVGANAGYYTLLASRLVGQHGTIIACEPDPKVASFLRAHVRANRLTNVRILETAVGAQCGTAHFRRGSGTGTGRLSNQGPLIVRVTTLDEIVLREEVVPTHIKIDVEGAELAVLQGGRDTLAAARPTVFLSTHGPQVHEPCCQLLQQHGYRLSAIGGGELATAHELLAAA